MGSCIDYRAKFEQWFSSEDYVKYIDDYVVGVSFYELDIEKDSDYFGHEFSLITSRPKNFKIDTIPTSDYKLNSIDTYLNLVKNIHKVNSTIEYDIEENSICYIQKDNIKISYSIRDKNVNIDIDGIGKVLSIVYLNKETKKILLVSVSFKSDLNQDELKIIFKNHIVDMFIKSGKTLDLIIKFLQDKSQSLISIQNTKEVKTSIILFSDITNSTNLLKSNSREGLFIIRELVATIAKTAEEFRFNINEIPGDGVLFSKDFHKLDVNTFIQFITKLYLNYNNCKEEILHKIKNSCEYQNNENMYLNFEDNLKKAYLKTAFCIDGIYFLPIKDISFKQSILYGANLWNIPRVFNDFFDKKNEGDILLVSDNLTMYLKAFLSRDIEMFISDINKKCNKINIFKYSNNHLEGSIL